MSKKIDMFFSPFRASAHGAMIVQSANVAFDEILIASDSKDSESFSEPFDGPNRDRSRRFRFFFFAICFRCRFRFDFCMSFLT